MELRKLFLPALAVAAYYVYTQKKAIGLLNYFIQGVGLQFQGLTPVLRLNVAIQNASNSEFKISAFIGSLTANGQNIGSISSFVPVVVPATSQVIYPLDIRLNLVGVASDIVNLINQGSGISQSIVFSGFVNANGIEAPVNLNYKIG